MMEEQTAIVCLKECGMPKHSLDNVFINGFRGLRDLKVNDLGRINILVGENNSGKTSVLEALSILCNPYEPFEWLSMVRRRDFGGLDETRVQSLRWCFFQTGELIDSDVFFQGQCDMECSGRFRSGTLHVEYEDMIGEPSPRELERLTRHRTGTGYSPDEQWRGAQISHFVESGPRPVDPSLQGSSTHSRIEPITIQVWEEDRMVGRVPRPRRPGNLPTETLTPYSYQLNTIQVRSQSRQMFLPLDTPLDERKFLLDILAEFDADIIDIGVASFRGARPAIYLNHRQLGPAPLSVFGDAIRRAVLLANTLKQLSGGGVLLIDEVETGIHVSALERVFAWMSKVASQLDVQLIATTHSLEAVDAISASMANCIDDLATYHLEQLCGKTNAKRISGELLLRIRHERGLDVR
ncbi:MAG: AAA family ATPase [Planctomycetaceae bacterium]|nr:AAA family ATPase [Planctomycetaceae bacterium]